VYYLGGIIALLLQDRRTMSTKSVYGNQYKMVTDQHWATGAQIKHSTCTLSDRIRELTAGTERSSVLGRRWKEKARSERFVVERSKPVRHPLGMTDHRESNDAWMVLGGDVCRNDTNKHHYVVQGHLKVTAFGTNRRRKPLIRLKQNIG